MAGKITVDGKTGKVTSAQLDVDYAGYISGAEKDLKKHQDIAGRVERALKSLGVTNRLLKEADHKKLGAAPNAAALLKDFQAAQFEVTTAHYAYDLSAVQAAEEKAYNELFEAAAAKTAVRMTEIAKEIQALKDEFAQLQDQKKGLLDQIKKAVEPRGKQFRDRYSQLAKAAKQLSLDYGRPNWDFETTERKYLKKK